MAEPREPSFFVGKASDAAGASKVRLDKWLWAARFYKTRSQATEAISAGHVKIRDQRAKAGQSVSVGLLVEVTKDQVVWQVEVRALSDKRGSGADAAKLYAETEEGKRTRERRVEELKAAPPALFGARPTKRDRRAMERFKVTNSGREPDDG